MRCFWTGLASAAVVLLWQALVVHAQFRGNWTALFCTGAAFEQPPELASEHIHRFEGSGGFDGQFYHYIAHDPFFQRDSLRYIDIPRLRYRRILVPLAAHIFAFGQSRFVDRAYIGVILLFVFLGSYWLSAFLSLYGFAPAWGAAFILIPGVLVSIDRLTVDVALIALAVGFALYFARGSPLALYLTLAAAPLVRETGLLVLAAYIAYSLLNRRWRVALIFSTAVIPTAAWYWFVALHAPSIHESRWFSIVPLAPLARRLLHPFPYPLSPPVALLANALDYVALAGMVLAMAIGFTMVRRLKSSPVAIGLFLFALLASFLADTRGWLNAYDFSRSLGPLLVFAALVGMPQRKWLYVAPIALVLPRVALQWGPHMVAIARWTFGGTAGSTN